MPRTLPKSRSEMEKNLDRKESMVGAYGNFGTLY